MRDQRSEGVSGIWGRFVLGLAIVATGLYLALVWFSDDGPWRWLPLIGALLLSGRLLLLPLLGSGGLREPNSTRHGDVERVRRPDGTELHVEFYGPADAPVLLLTHGWTLNSTAWYYAKQQLAERFRLVVWDLPGQGKSKGPANRDYSVKKMAADLEAVLTLVGPRPAVLVGHSLGGMIIQEFCRQYPHHLGRRVAGIVLAHTTFTNPLATSTGRRLWRAIQRPFLVPLSSGLIAFWPLAWLLSWLNYTSGILHLMVRSSNFAGHQTRGQVDYLAWLVAISSPAVVGRMGLATLAFESRDYLPAISLPALVVAGRQDHMTCLDAAAEIQRRLPAAELVTLSPAGHMGPWEQHEEFARLVSNFAARQLLPETVKRDDSVDRTESPHEDRSS